MVRRSKRNAIAKREDSGPAKVPGVCVALVGGLPEAVAEVRAYWRERAAIFVHHSGEAMDRPLLEQTLERAHIVFLSEHVSPEIGLRLESYAARTESRSSYLKMIQWLAYRAPLRVVGRKISAHPSDGGFNA